MVPLQSVDQTLLSSEYAVTTPSLFPLVQRGSIPGHPKAERPVNDSPVFHTPSSAVATYRSRATPSTPRSPLGSMRVRAKESRLEPRRVLQKYPGHAWKESEGESFELTVSPLALSCPIDGKTTPVPSPSQPAWEMARNVLRQTNGV